MSFKLILFLFNYCYYIVLFVFHCEQQISGLGNYSGIYNLYSNSICPWLSAAWHCRERKGLKCFCLSKHTTELICDSSTVNSFYFARVRWFSVVRFCDSTAERQSGALEIKKQTLHFLFGVYRLCVLRYCNCSS